MTMMIKIKSGRCRGRFEAKSKAEALVEALMGIGLLSQMPLCTTVFSAGLPCYIAQKNIATAILLCCIAPELWCFLYIELYCTVLPAISNATPQSILNSISAHTACVSTVYHFPRHCVLLYCSVEMPVHWLVMGSIIQRLPVTIIQQDRSKANHQTFHYDDDLHDEYDYQGKKQNAVLLHFPKRGGVVSPSPKFPKKKM